MELIGIIVLSIIVLVIYLKLTRVVKLCQSMDKTHKEEYQKLDKRYFTELRELQLKVKAMTKNDDRLIKFLTIVKETAKRYEESSKAHMAAKDDLDNNLSQLLDMTYDLMNKHVDQGNHIEDQSNDIKELKEKIK